MGEAKPQCKRLCIYLLGDISLENAKPSKKPHGQHGVISKETQRRFKMDEGGVHCGIELKPPQNLHGMEGFP